MTPKLSPRIYADLIGRPFALAARGPAAYDCLGLAMEIQRRRGLQLPAYLTDAAELHRAIAAGGFFSEAHRLDAPEPGAVVLMRSPGELTRHLGTMTCKYWMCHASEDAGQVVHEVLSRSPWSRRVLGYYRAESAA